ncbi:hypothetical protein BDV41DRAFT_538489 [Aspergillus transmontanensis]|uniref:Uncharacterized protein n=1 Tax=Aspergillus transmontanensis TaxID=1034304 RepID=A0A5N6VWK2_9EURO|nr:hypothetical protein BDV41DRAFT_538489 [Aspergillus transmontanensis]
MTPGSSEKISNALIQLQRCLKKGLKAKIKKGISQEKRSVVESAFSPTMTLAVHEGRPRLSG